MLSFTRYIFPPNIQKKLDIFSLNQRYKKELSRNLQLKNKYQGKRCFIIGNGPSINNQDLTKLKKEQTIVTNSFYFHKQYKQINPKFYCLADHQHFKDKKALMWLRGLEKKLSPHTVLFFPVSEKEFILKHKLFSQNTIHYHCAYGGFRENLDFNLDFNKVIPSPDNVVVASIILAINLGFTKIYLLGCDHTFIIPVGQEDALRFYTNHSFKNTSFLPTERRLKTVHRLFVNYRLLRKKIDKKIKIYNLTPITCLDVFPLKKYQQIIDSQ